MSAFIIVSLLLTIGTLQLGSLPSDRLPFLFPEMSTCNGGNDLEKLFFTWRVCTLIPIAGYVNVRYRTYISFTPTRRRHGQEAIAGDTHQPTDRNAVNRQLIIKPLKLLFTKLAIALTAGLFLSSTPVAWAADDVTRILLVPFNINAAKELSYLKRGINDMLTSRLEKDQKVIVVTADGDKADLKALSQKANADYVITGSVTIMGDSISTDSQVVKGSALDVPVLSFNRTGDREADLIKHINELAAAIDTHITGSGHDKAGQAATTVPAAPISASSQPSAPVPPVSTAQTSPVVRQPASASEPSRLPGIGPIKGQASGISSGDIDGDGNADIVTVTTDHLFVHHFIGGRWAKLAEYDSLGDFIGVDVADINGNGEEEIFVTRFSQNETRLQSFVLEWDGKTLQRIANHIPWYFRRVDFFERGQVLVCQRHAQAKRFSSGIYQVKWTGGAYELGERLALPRNLNVFGMAYGAVRIPGRPEVVSYNSDGYVEFQSPSGEETWVSTEHYGGGSNAIVFTDETQWDVQDYIFLSPRICLHDMDGDDIQELLVVNNQKSFKASSVLERHRFYAKGRLEWLKWQGEGIRSIGQTLDMTKFIADFALVDVDGDGELDVVAAVVQKTRGMTAKGSSYLVSFKIKSS